MGVASRSTPSRNGARRHLRMARLGAMLRDGLRSDEPEGDADHRFVALGHRVRLATALAALAATPFLPDTGRGSRLTLAALVAFVYLPSTFLAGRLSERSNHPAIRVLKMAGDAGIVFALSVLVPGTRVPALFAYLLLVAFHTFLGGLVMGVGLAVGVITLVIVAERAADERAVGAPALFVLFTVLVLLVVIVETATRERRRTARFLARLQRAISAVPAVPDLDGTLHSVGSAACAAVGAKFVSVLVREGADVVQAALEGDLGPDLPERSSEVIAEILREPETSPSGIVLTTGRRVVVPAVADDPRFARWIPEMERQGFTSTVAVPLRTGDTVIGVLAAYFRSPEDVLDEHVDLLAAYAEYASLVILRAMAYEHESRAAARRAETDAIKNELVSTVSHELRTPLTTVKGFIETVLRHWERFDDDERRALLERSLRSTDQLSALVDQVLDYSRLEAGGVITVSQPLDLDREVRRIVEERSVLLHDHPVLLDLAPGARAEGDREGLERVLDNLLSNAAKYSPPGTPVTVRTALEYGEAVVSVADEGPGIPEEDLERIFDRFYRVAGGQGTRGTGIGLAIVKRYAELMGGRVWAQSTPGEGSTFFLTLPAAVPAGATPALVDADAGPDAGLVGW